MQLLGGCSVFESSDSEETDLESVMDSGDALIIPAGVLHYGSNRFGAEGVSLRLNVVTPARKEYGPEDSTPYYPLKNRSR
ncbi:hypothetical protein H8J16_29115 [Klebsiella pneumoniae]|nr:hypothetical protein [Klebsiella pneumoniae]